MIRDLHREIFENNSINYSKGDDKKYDKNSSFYKNSREFRHIYESDLTFLGFIIIGNKLKTDTKNVIKQLKQSGCKIVMATGDNPLTSISVAKQCSLFDNDIHYLMDVEDNELQM